MLKIENLGKIIVKIKNQLACYVICILFLHIASCIPYPHKSRTFPEISGVYTENGKPKSGVSVHHNVSYIDGKCQNKGSPVQTNSDGGFNIAPEFRQAYFAVIGIVHTLHTWNLCFSDKYGNDMYWVDSSYGPSQAPEFVEVKCDPALEDFCKSSHTQVLRK